MSNSPSEHALADPHRAALLDTLKAARDGLDVRQLSDELGLHPNTVRWHVGHLTDAGLVRSRRVHSGRPGRPRLVFEAVADADGERSCRLLATMLASALVDGDGPRRAEQAGVEWGRHLVQGPFPFSAVGTEEAVRRIVELLDEHGFDPVRSGDAIEMLTCPFRDVVDVYGPVVCGLHRGLLTGALDALDAGVGVASLVPWARPGVCEARLAITGS